MKRKIIAAILALALLLSVTACAETKGVKLNKNNPTTVTMWHYYNGTQKTALDRLIDEFNETEGAQQGIIVEASNLGDVSQLTASVLDSADKKVGSKPIPNIFAAYADTAYQIDQKGLAADIEIYMTEEELAAYVPSYIEEGRLGKDRRLKIFPIAKSTEIMMLNKTDWEKFSSATGTPVSGLTTLEGLVETAKVYYEWSGGKAFFGRDAMANYFIIGCKQLGVDIFSVDDEGNATFNLDEDVMKKLWDCYYVPFVNGYFAANGKFRTDDAKVGDLIALVGSSTSATFFPENVILNDKDSYPVEAMVLPAPKFEGAQAYAVQQGAGMVVTKSTKEQEYASTVFLKWFTQPERNIAFSLMSSYLPVTKASNNMGRINEVIAKDPSFSFSPTIKQTLDVSIGTTTSDILYTNRAFSGGTQARRVLEDSLSTKAVQDSAKIQGMVNTGTNRQEAAKNFTTDQNFQLWLSSLKQALEATQKGT